MKRVSPIWVAVALAVLVAAVAIIYNVAKAPQGVGPALYRPPDAADKRTPEGRRVLGNIEIEGPSLVQRDAQGNEVWSARSRGELQVSDADQRVVAADVVWTLTRGQDRVTIKSPRMELNWSGGDVHFTGDIAIQDSRNRRFSAAQARFESGTQKVVSERGVQWSVGRYRVTADTLVIDLAQHKIRLRGNVRLVVQA